MKTEVYSWRVAPDLKSELEQEAHRRRISLAAALELAARDWLKEVSLDGEEDQHRIQQAALNCVGSLASGDVTRSENARGAVRERLRRRRDR